VLLVLRERRERLDRLDPLEKTESREVRAGPVWTELKEWKGEMENRECKDLKD